MSEKKLKKILKNLPSGMQEELDNLDIEELKQRIGKSATIVNETKTQMSEDPDVKQAQEVLKNLKEPYSDTLKAQESIIGYSVHLLKLKGKL